MRIKLNILRMTMMKMVRFKIDRIEGRITFTFVHRMLFACVCLDSSIMDTNQLTAQYTSSIHLGVDPPEEGRDDDFPPNNEEPTVVSNTDQSTRVDTHLLEQQMQDNTEFDNFEDNTNDEAPPPGGWNGEVWDYKLKPKGDARVEPSNNAKGMFNSFFQNLAGAAAATSNNGMNVDDTQNLDAAAAAAKVASAESNSKPASTSNHDFMDTHEVFIKEKLIQGGGKYKKQKVVMEKGMTSLAAAAAADERAATETERHDNDEWFFDEDL